MQVVLPQFAYQRLSASRGRQATYRRGYKRLDGGFIGADPENVVETFSLSSGVFVVQAIRSEAVKITTL